ncbi:nuclear transport factor 2 family protein [Actinoplanes sp. TFC3]|uniref:nuclear transport factor 2 family protein n=1 Tax=Actinoplanes sp. TFC3 TaxID=1710355 RepID=UPI00082EDD59|nr:nuclear transport factor 2 family protein [Actinoplanes sp. TFC3]
MTPHAIFERIRSRWLAGYPTFDAALLTEDITLETPFSNHSLTGRDRVLAYITAGHAAIPFRLTACHTRAIHETSNPGTIIIEYELSGAMTATGATATAPFVVVLTTRDGKVAGWREYQPDTIAAAMQGKLP